MKNYCVYCHTNKNNGKKYIGITSQKPESRWRNGQGYRNNIYFYRAIEKDGWHNFSHEILYTNLSKEEAEKIEVALIAEYETTNILKGYNLEAGGNANKEISAETRKKISEALKGHICTEETREKISKSQTGKTSPRKGIKATPEEIEKNRVSHLGKKPWNKGKAWAEEDRHKFGGKKVICVETQIIYQSMHDAQNKTGIKVSAICNCCKGRTKKAGGHHWEYVTAEEYILND